MPDTTKFDIFYPADTPFTPLASWQTTAESIETALDRLAGIGLRAARPASGTFIGQKYFATDEKIAYIWDGTVWQFTDTRFMGESRTASSHVTTSATYIDAAIGSVVWTAQPGRRYELEFTSPGSDGNGLIGGICINVGGSLLVERTNFQGLQYLREYVTNGTGASKTAKIQIKGNTTTTWGYLAGATVPAILTVKDVT